MVAFLKVSYTSAYLLLISIPANSESLCILTDRRSNELVQKHSLVEIWLFGRAATISFGHM